MTVSEQSIRTLAHQLWESEGKPSGQATRHWNLAARLVTNSDKTDSNKEGRGYPGQQEKEKNLPGEKKNPQRSVDPSEVKGPPEPEQPDQT